MLYAAMGTLGCTVLLVCVLMLRSEQRLREDRAKAAMHARIVLLSAPGREVRPQAWDLSTVDVVLGRRKRKADLNLDDCGDQTISRLHARLWYDGRNYCLTPFPRPDRPDLPTRTYLNNKALDFSGAVLRAGDTIRLGQTTFRLIDTGKEWES